MDFAGARQDAIDKTREQLRAPLTKDRIFVLAHRCAYDHPLALEHWLFAVLPEMDPTEARLTVSRRGRNAWNPDSIGAEMDLLGWKALQLFCRNKNPSMKELSKHAAPNLHTLVGEFIAAILIDAAGSLENLAKMTQRDIMRLGNESGTFGGEQQKSIIERHELATSDRALRILCSRTILAARLDFYKGQYKGESLRQEVLYAQ